MRSRLRTLAWFASALLLLRQGIALLDTHLGVRREQAAAVEKHDVDPRALFYAESEVALAAEKDFRRRLREGGTADAEL